MSVEGASAWRQGFSSAEKRPRPRRPSMGSTPLTFHKTKGKFASGVLPSDQPERLSRLRKDALEDFNKATVERDVSVHQMAALFASSAGSDRGDGPRTSSDIGGSEDGDGGRACGSRSDSFSSLGRPNGSTGGSEAGSLHGPSRPFGLTLEAALPEKKDASPFASSEGSRYGEVARPSTPCTQSKYTSFTHPSATDLRALDLKQRHLDEARILASNRSANVKDIANAFNGRSRSENVEVFQKRRAAQEAAYKVRVHEGRETLKKTSQGTDAMYNFVLKLNLATTEGKERFMRRWAVGRLASGEQPTPVEGWKFLQSLGIDAAGKKDRRATTASSAKGARDASLRLRSRASSATPSLDIPATQGSSSGGSPMRKSRLRKGDPGEEDSSNEVSSDRVDQPRGRSPVRTVLKKFDIVRSGSEGMGNGRRATCVFGDAGRGDDEHEVAAWEAALNRAVGATTKVDTDACAPEILRARLRRRSGSEPRRASPKLPQGPETCRPTSSKAFWGTSTNVPAPPLTVHARPEDPRDVSVSPTGSPVRFTLPQMWSDVSQRVIRERPSRSMGASSDRRMSVQSRRTSDGLSWPNSSPPKGLRLTSLRLSGSPSHFSLSPSHSGSAERPRLGVTRENSLSSCSTEAMITRVPPTSPGGDDWESSFRQSGSLELPEDLRERAEKSLSEVSDDEDIDSMNLSGHGGTSVSGGPEVFRDEFPGALASFASGDALRRLSEKAFPSDEEFESDDDEEGHHEEEEEEEVGDIAEMKVVRDHPCGGSINLEALARKSESIGKLTIEGGDIAGGDPGCRASDETEDAMARAQRLSEIQRRLSDRNLAATGILSDAEDHDDAQTVEYDVDDKDDVMPGLATPRSFDQVKDATDRESFSPRACLGNTTPLTEDEECGVREDSMPHRRDRSSSVTSAIFVRETDLDDADDNKGEDLPHEEHSEAVVSQDEVAGFVPDVQIRAYELPQTCNDGVEGGVMAKESPMRSRKSDPKKTDVPVMAIKVDVVHPPMSESAPAPAASGVTGAFPVESSHGGSMDLTCKEVLSSEPMSDAVSVSVYDADMSMSDAASEHFSDQSYDVVASEVGCDEEPEAMPAEVVGEVDNASVTASADGDDEASTGIRRSSLKELKIAIGDDTRNDAPVRRLEWGLDTIGVGSPNASCRDEDTLNDREVCAPGPADVEEANDPEDTARRLGLSGPDAVDVEEASSVDEGEPDDEVSSVIICGDEVEVASAEEAGGPPASGSCAATGREADEVPSAAGACGVDQPNDCYDTRRGMIGRGEVENAGDLASLIALASMVPPPMRDADKSPTKTGERLLGRSHRRQRSMLPNEFADEPHPKPPEKVEMTIMSPARRASLIQSPRTSIAVFGSPDNAMRLGFARKGGILGPEQGTSATGDGAGNFIRSPRSPSRYYNSARLDQIAEVVEDVAKPEASAEANLNSISSPAIMSAARDASDFSDSDQVSSDADHEPEAREDCATEEVVDRVDEAEASQESFEGRVGKDLAGRDEEVGAAGKPKEDVIEDGSKEVGDPKAGLNRERFMTEQTEDTASPESRRISSSNNSKNSSPSTEGPSGVEGPIAEEVEQNTEVEDEPDRFVDTCQAPSVGADPYVEPPTSSVTTALPSTPLPLTPNGFYANEKASMTPTRSSSGSPEVMNGPSPDRLPDEPGDDYGGDGARLSDVELGDENESRKATRISVSSGPVVDVSPQQDGDEAAVERRRDVPETRPTNERLEVGSINPYEDFDALHDRQYTVNNKPNCAGAFNFLGFCRPRSARPNHNNPSTKGSGLGFFRLSMDDVASTTGTIEVDRPTPGGLLGFCTPGSRIPSVTTSTRGKKPKFFSLMEDGTARAELECQTPGSVLGSCNARSAGLKPPSARGKGFGFSPVRLSEEEVSEVASEGQGSEDKIHVQESGFGARKERDSGNGLKGFLENRPGLGCTVS